MSIKDIIRTTIEVEYGRISQRSRDRFIYEMYADYRDKLGEADVNEILASENPEHEFEEVMDDFFCEERWEYEDRLIEKIWQTLNAKLTEQDLSELQEDDIKDYMNEYIIFDVPRDHFLNQKYNVNIMLDTGDGNFDYVLNSVYPCWYGREEDYHNSKASIVWLAKQQGYGKRAFRKAMNEGDISNPTGFLESMRQELANLPSHMSTVTFLVKMSLKDLMELNALIRLQDRNGHYYDATQSPYCGYIVLDKNTETGLFNPWQGGGSVFEIELERDVKIPIRFIRSALPDGGDGYSVSEVYGMCASVWRDTVKVIHAPKFSTKSEQ